MTQTTLTATTFMLNVQLVVVAKKLTSVRLTECGHVAACTNLHRGVNPLLYIALNYRDF